MAGSYNSQANPGSFIPTTNIWDVVQVEDIQVPSKEFNELLVRMYQNLNRLSINVNLKDTGYYTIQEFLNGQLFFPDPMLNSSTSQNPAYRQVFRTVVNFGQLPNAGTKSVPHGISMTQNFSFTRIYGTASNSIGLSFLPLPYASPTAANNIELNVDGTNVNITTGSDRTAYLTTYVILEYIKQ